MAALTVNASDRDGTVEFHTVKASAGGAGDTWANTGQELLLVDNQNVGTVVLTLDIQATVDGETISDKTVSIATGEFMVLGPFDTAKYSDSSGNMNISFDDETNVSVAVVKKGAA